MPTHEPFSQPRLETLKLLSAASTRHAMLAVIRDACHDPDSHALLELASHCHELDPVKRPSAAQAVDLISQPCGIRPEHLD